MVNIAFLYSDIFQVYCGTTPTLMNTTSVTLVSGVNSLLLSPLPIKEDSDCFVAVLTDSSATLLVRNAKKISGQGMFPYGGLERGSEVDFHLLVVSDRGEWQLLGTFSKLKTIALSQSYRILKSRTYIQLPWVRELESRLPEYQLLNLSSPTYVEMEA